jgi:hypothetical protein
MKKIITTEKHQNRNMSRKAVYIYICIAVFTVLLNILSWSSAAFSDAYIAYVFPIWVNTYGRLTGLVDFSVGEWMLGAGILLVICAVVLLPGLFFAKLRSICRKFYLFFAWVFIAVCLIMTLNCFILYHASPLSEKYFNGKDAGDYTLADVISVRNMVVEKCNELSTQVKRDEQGRVDYSYSTLENGKLSDMQDKAVEAMKNLGMMGYFPRPKALAFSDFMCQQYMQGYYFPFSMEANYNDVMYVMNKPFTMCHELAHLKGYIYEDEANFIGYMACIKSDDIYFQYSGYLSAYSYLENDLIKAKKTAPSAFEQAVSSQELSAADRQVYEDNIFVEQSEWERIEDNALIPTETVDKAADTFIDANLRINGVDDGALSYNRMVELLMLYYYQ